MSKSMYPIPPAAGPYNLDSLHESDGHVPNPNSTLASKIASNMEPRKSVAGYIPTPNRSDRKLQFGIDCAELVHFSHWEPGGEHVQNLVVKNVVMKTQKIKYKLPKTRFFSMDFPETVTLSAGMSWTIPITFRPVAKECYTDVIEFTTSFGRFLLPIKATLPEHVLEHPPSIDFTLCPIRETARRPFALKNVGELASTFEWDISSPFRIAPRIGTLNPGQAVTIAIDFHPENASVFTAVAICNFGDKNQWERSKVTQAVTVYGIGKFSHLSIEGASTNFNFGRVFVGKRLEKRFNVWNHSDVPSNFRIVRAEKNTEPYFQFSTTTGTIAPHKSLEISITYIPVAAGMDSTEYFDIATVSGNTIHITCSGVGAGPSVSLNTSLVNFNDVQANTTCMRPIYIQNDATITAFYQFLTEPNSLFRIDKPWGTIGPNSSVALTIRFTPKEPINYYRRVYCLVEHQDALYVEFIGTCYNDKRRPATFHTKMLDNYRLRVQNGLWSFGPEHLEEMLKSGTIQCRDGVLSFSNLERHKDVEHEVLDYPYNDGLVSSEYFYENTGSDQAVTLMDTYIDFGSCSKYRVIDHQTIRIRNNTRGKMSCVWHMPGENLSDETVFTVTPAIADIAPKSIIEFRVHFRPRTDNSFFGQQLECFVHFKSMRNFRLVNEDTFTPPWCLTPTVAGNTFPAGQDTFIPKIEFGATRLEFPASHVDKSAYRTVRISNTGDTPVKFAFADTDNNKKDSMSGIGGSTQIASPPRLQQYSFTGKEIILYFIGTTIPFEQKCLHFHSAHHIFAPVSIGTSNPPIQSFRLANHGLLHLSYTIDTAPLQKLKAAEHDFEVFTCSKVSGSIPPGFVHWVFRPLEVREYSVDVPVTTDDGKTSIITFSGHGIEEPPHIASMNSKSADTVPSLQILSTSNQIGRLSKEHINFGAIPLGSQSRDLIVVRNTSATDKISFQWRVPVDALYGQAGQQCIQITPTEGVLEAGDSRFVKIVFVPVSNVCVYDLDLECVIVNETQKAAFEHFQETVSIAIREGRLSMDPRTASPSTTAANKPLLGSAGSSKHALRGSKYSPLPEIYNASVKPHGISVPDLFHMPTGAAVSHKPVDAVGIDFDAAPVQQTPQSLFDKMYHPHRSNYAKIQKEKSVFADGDQLNLFQSTMEEMMDEIFQDPEVQALIAAPSGTESSGSHGSSVGMLPYFAQISTNEKRNGIFLAHSDASDEGKSEKRSRGGSDVQDLFASEVLGARYFQNWVENILESTLYNLIQEANVGELDVTKECFLPWPKE
ncbi:hypothetical protein HDU81_005357 [Chytriomyces hyalinus]|nr:hypothetical protein HDU81_005357 [Chytriomyces hyalinus]